MKWNNPKDNDIKVDNLWFSIYTCAEIISEQTLFYFQTIFKVICFGKQFFEKKLEVITMFHHLSEIL